MTSEQRSKLPRWALAHIEGLESEVRRSRSQLDSLAVRVDRRADLKAGAYYQDYSRPSDLGYRSIPDDHVTLVLSDGTAFEIRCADQYDGAYLAVSTVSGNTLLVIPQASNVVRCKEHQR